MPRTYPTSKGDMRKSVYDADDDGVVDNSEGLEGQTLAQTRVHAPQAHTASHEPTGADEVNDIDIGNTGVLLSAHAARHQAGGADVLDFIPVNRAAGVTPTVTGFGTDPTNLANTTDGDWTTVTGTGQTVVGGSALIGTIDFDLGAVYTVLVTAKFGLWCSAGQLVSDLWHSTDGNTWVQCTQTNIVIVGVAAEAIRFPLVVGIRSRYFRFAFYSTQACTGNVKIYEVQAVEFPNIAGTN